MGFKSLSITALPLIYNSLLLELPVNCSSVTHNVQRPYNLRLEYTRKTSPCDILNISVLPETLQLQLIFTSIHIVHRVYSYHRRLPGRSISDLSRTFWK